MILGLINRIYLKCDSFSLSLGFRKHQKEKKDAAAKNKQQKEEKKKNDTSVDDDIEVITVDDMEND